MSSSTAPTFASIRISDGTQNWKHAGPETTPDAIAEHYRTAGYVALGYHADLGKETSINIEIELLGEDGDLIGLHDSVTVGIPADPSME